MTSEPQAPSPRDDSAPREPSLRPWHPWSIDEWPDSKQPTVATPGHDRIVAGHAPRDGNAARFPPTWAAYLARPWWQGWMLSENLRDIRWPRTPPRLGPPEEMRAAADRFASDVKNLIARRIRAARIEAGFRQIDLAPALGTNAWTISRIERAKRGLTIDELLRIAIQLRKPIGDFLAPPPRELRIGWARREPVTGFLMNRAFKALEAEDGEMWDAEQAGRLDGWIAEGPKDP